MLACRNIFVLVMIWIKPTLKQLIVYQGSASVILG